MIRKMTDDDIEPAICIWKDAMPLAHKGIPHEHWIELLPNLEDELKNSEERYVYEKDHAIVGFIAMRSRGNYIYELCVDNSMQGNGIGKKLVDELKSTREYLTLHVYKQNVNVGFYTSPKIAFEIKEESSMPQRDYPKLFMKWSRYRSTKNHRGLN
jgi:ribosomal protein S18 acetylase RimI-like enzyme